MITDVRASQMFLLLHEAESVVRIAGRLKMSEKTVRKFRDWHKQKYNPPEGESRVSDSIRRTQAA